MSEVLETPFERWKAIFEGKMLVDRYNCFAFLNAEKTKVIYTQPNSQYETATFITEDFDYNTDFEWRVYNPELEIAVERLSKMADPEQLSFQQACAAIGRDECVENQKTKDIFGPLGLWFGRQQEWVLDLLPCKGLYRIVPDPSKQVEEKPSLTYEQALECEKVRIHWPCLTDPIFVKGGGRNLWTADDLVAFDLAERRGYRIESVD